MQKQIIHLLSTVEVAKYWTIVLKLDWFLQKHWVKWTCLISKEVNNKSNGMFKST